MSKVLFLDFDGVLGPKHNVFYEQNCEKNIRAKREIRRVLEETDCNIVVSSTYRIHLFIEEMAELLCMCDAIPNPERVVGETPIMVGGERGDEITSWLNDNRWVTEFAIADDREYAIHCTRDRYLGSKYGRQAFEKQVFISKRLANRFVQPDHFSGVTKENADELINILNGNKSNWSRR